MTGTSSMTKNLETSNSNEDFHECSEDSQNKVIVTAYDNHYEDVNNTDAEIQRVARSNITREELTEEPGCSQDTNEHQTEEVDTGIQESDTYDDSIQSLRREDSLEMVHVRVLYYVENEFRHENKKVGAETKEEEKPKDSKRTGSTGVNTCSITFIMFIWVSLLILVWIFIG